MNNFLHPSFEDPGAYLDDQDDARLSNTTWYSAKKKKQQQQQKLHVPLPKKNPRSTPKTFSPLGFSSVKRVTSIFHDEIKILCVVKMPFRVQENGSLDYFRKGNNSSQIRKWKKKALINWRRIQFPGML